MKLHKLSLPLRRGIAGFMAAAMVLGLSACQKPQETVTQPPEEAGTEENQESTEQETQAPDEETSGGEESASNYLPTEENENEEVVMNDQPESSYWFPQQLLDWNAEEDPDLAYNICTVPLGQRADREKLQTVTVRKTGIRR